MSHRQAFETQPASYKVNQSLFFIYSWIQKEKTILSTLEFKCILLSFFFF